LKKQSETAKNQNQNQAGLLHGRQLAIQFVHQQTLQHCGPHQNRSCFINGGVLVGCKKQQDRKQIQNNFQVMAS
jgi:hypothetical protein